jgi:hypothetical protein
MLLNECHQGRQVEVSFRRGWVALCTKPSVPERHRGYGIFADVPERADYEYDFWKRERSKPAILELLQGSSPALHDPLVQPLLTGEAQ